MFFIVNLFFVVLDIVFGEGDFPSDGDGDSDGETEEDDVLCLYYDESEFPEQVSSAA